jgi:hypothetical protein
LSEKLSDIEVLQRLRAAQQILGDEEAETERGQTALESIRKALWLFGCTLVEAITRRET